MKIGIFTENYREGGLDTFIINLINCWPENDNFVIICNKDHKGLYLYEDKIIKNTKLIQHDLPLFSRFFQPQKGKLTRNIFYKTFLYFLRPFLFIQNEFALKKIFENIKLDRLMVVNGGYPAGDSCRAASIAWGKMNPYELAIHNFHNFAVKPSVKNIVWDNYIDYKVIKWTKEFISVSKCCSESICQNRYFFRNIRNVSYIYNGITETGIHNINPDIKNELKIDLKSKLCVMIATFEERKGHRFLLESFTKVVKAYNNTHLLICGTGNIKEEEQIKRYISDFKLSDHVFLLGFRSDVKQLIEESDIVLIPSQSFESFGLTAVEAMISKKPVVSTSVGGLKEVIKNECGGYCVSKTDTDYFAKLILELLNNEELAKKQGELGYRRYKENFTAEKMVTQYSLKIR